MTDKHWTTHDGRVAHPDSPSGGCGTGNSRVPGVLNCPDSLHPDSPALRHGRDPHHLHHPNHVVGHDRHLELANYHPPSPIPGNLVDARSHIMGWIATDERPKDEWQRMWTQNPNTPEHNLRVTYSINYALLLAGVRPHVDLPANKDAELARRALWLLTGKLRRHDENVAPKARIGSSEAIFLRDAQRYLYGIQGTAWIRNHVGEQYPWAKPVSDISSAQFIDDAYGSLKQHAMFFNALVEKASGKNPGLGRTGTSKLPLSPPGGDAWFRLALEHYEAAHPAGPQRPFNLLLKTPPTTQEINARLL